MKEIIGFGKNLPEKVLALAQGKELIFTFDSGTGVSLDDAFAHTFVSGITGSGKTTSVGAPLLKGALATGCAAFIADHKGNLRKIARKICKLVGREKDIIEFGTGPLATPINLLADITINSARQIFSLLIRKSCDGKTGNQDFHEKGVQNAVDVLVLTRIMHKAISGFPCPNLALISEILMDEQRAKALYQHFKENIYNEVLQEHYDLIRRVESSPFHILSDGERKSSSGQRTDQVAYALGMIRLALNRFIEIPALKRNFCAGDTGLDLYEALENRKIILFRLDPGTGPVGEDLCRMFIESWYQSIIARGADYAIPSFTFLDEFQSICNLSDSRFSDKRFAAESREFKGAVAILTQNIAGLGDGQAVNSLIHNLNTKIMLYNSDPATKESISAYGDADLTALGRGEAFVVRFDSTTGEHIAGIETCNTAFESMKNELAQIADDDLEIKIPAIEQPKSLSTAMLLLESKGNNVKTKPSEPEQMCKKVTGVRRANKYDVKGIRIKFPEMFAADAQVTYPKGWAEFLEKAFLAFREAGLPIKITKIDTAGMQAISLECDNDSPKISRKLLDLLLKDISRLCPFCGKPVLPYCNNPIDICQSCTQKFGLNLRPYENASQNNEPVKVPVQLLNDDADDWGVSAF